MGRSVDLSLDRLIGAVFETIAVAHFVTAAGEVLAATSVLGDVAGVVLKEGDVRGGELASRAGGGKWEVSVRHASILPSLELRGQGPLQDVASGRGDTDRSAGLELPSSGFETKPVRHHGRPDVGERSSSMSSLALGLPL